MTPAPLDPPVIEASIPLMTLLLYAAFNPATIAVAFWLGRKADQAGKLIIAAFAGSMAGIAVLYVGALLHVGNASTLGRGAAGVFVVSLLAGLAYAFIGYRLKS